MRGSVTRQMVRLSPWENLPRTRLVRHIGLTRPVWPGSAQGPLFPLWLPPPCFQKSRATVLPAPNDRHNKFPTARASRDSLVSSRQMIVGRVKFFTHPS